MAVEPGQLESVWLSDVHFEANDEFDRNDASKWSYVVEPTTTFGDIQHTDTDPSVTWTTVAVNAEIAWTWVGEGGQFTDAPCELDITVSGLFAWRQGQPEDDRLARLWLEYNATYLLWPYLRQHISALTTMSNIPALMIYTMSIPESPEIDEISGENPASERTPDFHGGVE